MLSSSKRPIVRVGRGATYIFIQGFSSALLGVIYIMFLTRFLPEVEEIGVFAILTFILFLAQALGTFALPSAATKYVSQYLAEGKREEAKSIVARIMQITIITSLVSFFLLISFADALSKLLGAPSLVFQILSLASVFIIFYTQAGGFLQGLQKMREYAIINFAFTVIQYGSTIVLVFFGFGLLSIVIGWVLGYATASVVSLAVTAKCLGLFGKRYPLKPLAKFSFPLFISGILSFMSNWVDQLFILPFLGKEKLGIYNIVTRAYIVPNLISTSIIIALFPQLSELYAREGESALRDAFRVSTRYAIAVGFPLIAGLAVLAHPIMILFAGPAYAEGSVPLVILCVASLFAAVGVPITPTLLTLGRSGLASAIAVVAILVDTLMSYVALAFLGWGMIGVAWARFLFYAVSFVLGAFVVVRTLDVKFDGEMLWKASASCGALTGAVVLLDLARQFLTGSGEFLRFRLLFLPIYVIVGAAAYISALIALNAVKKRDVELVEEYLPSRLKWLARWLNQFIR
ncbi:MAG: flippase [Candidatus Bathyarchaeia archaeon]